MQRRQCVMSCRLQASKKHVSEGYRLPENNYSQQAIDFMDKVLEISGLGDKTFLTDGNSLISAMSTAVLGGASAPATCLAMHAGRVVKRSSRAPFRPVAYSIS